MDFSSWFGLIPVEKNRFFSLAMGYLVRFLILILFVPNMVMFYRSAIINLDIGTALECAIFVSSHVAVNTQTYSCIWNKMKLHALYQLTITEIEQKKKTETGRFYVRMDNLFFIIKKWFVSLLFAATFAILVPPLGQTLFSVWTADEATFNLPIKIWLPFQINSLQIYLLIFCVSSCTLWSTAVCKAAATEIFFRYGLHLMARCDEFRYRLKCLVGLNLKHKKDAIHVYNAKFQAHFKELVDFHEEMLEYYHQYSAVVSGIIFFEFTTLIGLTVAAASSLVKSTSLDDDLFSIECYFVMACGVSSMFISSKMGNEVSQKFADLPIAVYSTEWHDWPVIYQKYAQVVLMLTQESRILSGFGLIQCDLRTFSQTMNTILTFILVLKEL